MTDRQWNTLLNRNINGGESMKALCDKYGLSRNTGKEYKKRHLHVYSK